MIKAECICGAELQAAESSAGYGFACEQCGQKWRLTIGGEPLENERIAWALLVESKLHHNERALLAGAGPIGAGKLPEKSLYLPGTMVSRNHCRFVRHGDSWRIEDQKSTNGLYVNYSRVTTHDLQPDDLITIGEYDLRFVPVKKSETPVPVVATPFDEAELLQSIDDPLPTPSAPSEPEPMLDLVDLDIEMEVDHPGEMKVE